MANVGYKQLVSQASQKLSRDAQIALQQALKRATSLSLAMTVSACFWTGYGLAVVFWALMSRFSNSSCESCECGCNHVESGEGAKFERLKNCDDAPWVFRVKTSNDDQRYICYVQKGASTCSAPGREIGANGDCVKSSGAPSSNPSSSDDDVVVPPVVNPSSSSQQQSDDAVVVPPKVE